ncbi:MAG: decarboxylase, partial [Elusimicrobia bacterium GWD2_63_28]
MITKKQMQDLAKKHGTPLFIVDHDEIRKNYAQFKKYLPRVQAYYAVKAEPMPEIVKTLYKAGASFDVASMPEFMIVHEYIKNMPDKKRLAWIWDKIIYANPIKPNETLKELDQYRPLVTFDNLEEIHKIKKYAPNAGLCLRIRVPNTGAVVELSSKFGASPGESVDLILEAVKQGLGLEGLSFHVGSQTTNFENYVQAINLAADIFKEAKERGYDKMNLLDIGGGFPAPYDASVKPFQELAKKINSELERLFPDPKIEILAEPGR